MNLGIGMPAMVADYIPAGIDITLHSENGMLGVLSRNYVERTHRHLAEQVVRGVRL